MSQQEPSQEVRPQPKQMEFLRNKADICIFGGSAGGGKSWSLLLEPLFHKDNANFTAVIFRRTYPQIVQPGGLWTQSSKVYPGFHAIPNQTACKWTFPSGATVQFAHLQHDKDVHSWMGSEIPLICFDELTHFSEEQFWYLLSRNRSTSGVRPYVRASCNPDADSFVAKLLEWWIDQDTGLPIPERAGQRRWFVRVNDALEWSDTPAQLIFKHPGSIPKSLSFVPAKLEDNPALMRADPNYLANLMALPLVERERLWRGNWKIRSAAGLVFNEAWFKIVPASPRLGRRVRAWDKAGTAGRGDYSVGVLMSDSDRFYVEDVIRGQWSSAERNRIIRETAWRDGPDVEIWLEQEPGSGGKESAEISLRELAGFVVHANTVTGDKLTRARQFSAQVEAGNVCLVAGPWNRAYIDELVAFPVSSVDDQVDASSGAFNRLALGFRGEWDPEVTPGVDSRNQASQAPEGMWLNDSAFKKW